MTLKNSFVNFVRIIYSPDSFWKYTSNSNMGYKKSIFIFTAILIVNVIAGICGRYIYALSTPTPVDYFPETASSFFVPVIIMMIVTTLSVIFIKGQGGNIFLKSLLLTTYSMIPYLVISIIVFLIRDLFFFGLLGLYSLYVYKSGLINYCGLNSSKANKFTIIVTIVIIPVYYLSDLLCRYLIVNFVLNA